MFRVLGPLQIWTGTGWSSIGAAKWRALLAVLLAEPGRSVSTERLIDELWGDDPPAGARKLVSGYVLRLRRLTGDPDGQVLVTQPPGYRLMARRDDLDACRFEDLLATGRGLLDSDPGMAVETLDHALALWTGPALADVPRGQTVSAEADRLEELRLTAVELRIEASMCCGQGGEQVPQLCGLTTQYPMRERFWHQMMRALEESGRPAEALEVYARASKVLSDELGTEPGPDLQQLHQQILAGHRAQGTEPRPGLRAPAAVPAPAVVPRQLPPATRHFAGREQELRRLSGLLDEVNGATEAVVISAIGGTAGVGNPKPEANTSNRYRAVA